MFSNPRSKDPGSRSKTAIQNTWERQLILDQNYAENYAERNKIFAQTHKIDLLDRFVNEYFLWLADPLQNIHAKSNDYQGLPTSTTDQ